MLTRQKILLKLLADRQGSCSKLELAKLAFLLANEGKSDQLKTFYEFVPYKFGPYSFTMAHELKTLVKEGCIESAELDVTKLTQKGKRLSSLAMDARLSRDIELINQSYGDLKQSKLLEFVYDKYPWFTVNSQFPKKRKAKIASAKCANYAIGYQSYQVDGLLNKLMEAGIQMLVDTRSNPVSRRYGYHKSSLSQLSKLVGIEYRHCPEVGVPSSWRQDIETESEYEALFERYEKEILCAERESIASLSQIMTNQPSALLCRESDALHCHRSRLADALKKLNKLPVIELCIPESISEAPLFKFNKILLS